MKILNAAALVLVIIGGLNWGLIGLFEFNLVSAIFGVGILADIIYVLVGIAAIYSIALLRPVTRHGLEIRGTQA